MQLNGVSRRGGALLVGLFACSPDGGARFEFPPATTSGGSSGGEVGAASGALPGDASSEPGPPSPPPEDSGGPASGGTLIAPHAAWRYSDLAAGADDWTALEFDDSAWPEGQAPFGDDASAATEVAPALGLRLRRRFVAAAGATDLRIYLRRGDGAAVYLNGEPLARSNLGADPRPADAVAEADLAGAEALRYVQLAAPATALRDGDNVIAVEVRRAAAGKAGLRFDLQLDVWDLAAEPTDRVFAQVRTISYDGKYADEHAAVAWIEDADGGFVRTLAMWAEVRREHLIRWRSVSDGDVADALTSATLDAHATTELRWDLRDRLGQLVPPGAYTLLVEFTEDNSNKGAPAGPVLAAPFMLGGGPRVAATPTHPRFADLLLVTP